jgi:uncharacterized iron-regulated protein
MAKPPSSARREEVAFHKEMVRQLKREIALIDRNSRRKYIREFDEEYRTYQEISSFDDLIVAGFKADIIYVGDYHALPQSQRFAARLLNEIAVRSRHVHLAVEMVFGRSQRILDRWMEGEMADEEMLRRIRYHLDWGYEWESFRRVLQVARERGVTVHGVDCEPRAGFRFIRKRDQYAAQRLVSILQNDPEAKVVVVFGESHVATGHLPARVRELLKRSNLERRELIVVQNVERIYWQLAEQGHHHVEVVRCSPSRFCVFNASPLAKYEAYRQTIERWKVEGEDDEQLDLTPTVYNMIDTILKFLRIDKYRHRLAGAAEPELLVDAFPEVYSDMDLSQFRQTLRRSRFRDEEISEIEFHVERNGSCYIPRINAIYIGRFNLAHGGEEAAHFVNMALRGEIFADGSRRYPTADLFYVTVLEEALGFFGSKLIDPSRNHFFETDFYRFYKKSREEIERETPYRYEEFREIIDFILLHKKFERSYDRHDDVPEPLLRGIHHGGRFSVLTHELGYFLGQQLYDGYHAGVLPRASLQELYRRRYEPGGDALGVYLDLVGLLGGDDPGSI